MENVGNLLGKVKKRINKNKTRKKRRKKMSSIKYKIENDEELNKTQ